MLSWQRRLRLGLGLFILVFAVGLFFSVRRSARRPGPPAAVSKSDPKAVVQGTNGRFVLSSGSEAGVVVDYERWLTYGDGSSRLLGVRASIPHRGGRDFTAKAREGRVGNNQQDVSLTGAVEMTASDGLSMHTEVASYSTADATARAEGRVEFVDGRTSGNAIGMTFDRNRDVLSLLNQAVIHVAPDEKGQGAADVRSGAATFARRDKFIKFERGMQTVREGQTIAADEATALLTDDGKQMRALELRGSSSVAGEPKASGGLKAMTARDIDITYGPDGQTLQHALLKGGGAIELTGATPSIVRRISGETIDIAFAADGTTVTGLDATDAVQLALPAEDTTPARVIRAASLVSTGDPVKGLTSARFAGGHGVVEFRETPTPPASVRVARSATMDLAMQGGFSSIESARFGGGVRFEEGDMAAVAGEATYALAKELLALSGRDPRTGRVPQVVDEQVSIEGRTIDIGLEGRKVHAADAVKSDIRPKKKPADGKTPPAKAAAPRDQQTRIPAMLKQDQPVSATADRLDYDGAASHAVYTGHAQLWQADTTIKGDQVVLDDQKGDLSASGHVVTNMTLMQAKDTGKEKEAVHSTATAKDMVYADEFRQVTYTGGAHLNGPQGDLTAEKIELYLKESGNEVDRLEAYTDVRLTTPDKRKATGARLTYLAPDERYTMTGPLVKIEEECRETTGKTLTFFRSADRIIIDGNEKKRTETKGVGACGSAPRTRD
jgi:LPS export ABC transporter protein LptC